MQKLLILLLMIFYLPCAYAGKTLAILDIDKAITNSESYKSFKSSWDSDNAKYRKELEYYESRMVELDKRIIQESGSASPRDLEKMKKQLSEYESTIQKLVEDRKNKLESEFSQALYKIKATLIEVVNQYAKNNDISVVLSKSQIVYTDDASEITDQILVELNSKLKTLPKNGRRY